jgi:uncharacterized protein
MAPAVPKLLLIAGLVALCLGAAPGRAAAFECTRISSATERAICADRTLSRLADDLAAAYADVLKDFQLAGLARESPAVSALESSQRAWQAVREYCAGEAACIGSVYRRRLAVLASRPDPGAPSPVDGFIGAFAVEHTPRNADFAITLFKGEGDTALVEIAATGRNIACSIVGIGRLDAAGRLAVRIAPDTSAAGALLVSQSASGITIASGAAASAACGKRGDLAQDYARLDPMAVAAAAAIAAPRREAAALSP